MSKRKKLQQQKTLIITVDIFDIGYYVMSGEENKVLKFIMCISSLLGI